MGRGFTRLGTTVLVPELALQGSELIAVAVLEDPDTGDWFGEDPTYPGSALVAIDKDRVVPRTPDAVAALEEVAAAARELLNERVAQAADAFARRCHALARQAAADLPRPTLSDLAVDLGRVVRGSIPPAATWRRTPDGVRLMTLRKEDDPLGWVDEWSSTEDLLVLDGLASRDAAEALVATVASGPAVRPDEIDEVVRQSAIQHLTLMAPGLAELVNSQPDTQATTASRVADLVSRASRDHDPPRQDASVDYELTQGELLQIFETERKRAGRVLWDVETWDRMVAAFKLSRHTEPRETNSERDPQALPSERQVLSIYGSHVLFQVTDPPGWGYRLVSLVNDDFALAWELPGYNFAEAKRMSVLLVDDYL